MITYNIENEEFSTLAEAVEFAEGRFSVVELFADRGLCWDSEEEAKNDDGANAVGEIYALKNGENINLEEICRGES